MLIVCVSAVVQSARAERYETDWSGIPEAQVRLVAATVPDVEEEMLGLQFIMAPGWKVYWRSPGDAGFPPVAKWEGSTGVNGMTLMWPVPRRFTFYGLETYGYEETVVLPVRIERTGGPVSIRLDLFYAACADICVPVQTSLQLELSAERFPVSVTGYELQRALSESPEVNPEGHRSAAWLTATDEITTEFEIPNPIWNYDLIVEGPEGFVFATPVCRVEPNPVSCTVGILEQPENTSLAGQSVTLTLHSSGFGAETVATVTDQR